MRLPWLTLGVIAANVATYLAVGPLRAAEVDVLVRAGGKAAALILDLGQTWRLLTANLLHKGLFHLALNMAALLAAGGMLENTYRRLDLALLLLMSGVGAISASLWLSDAISVGASGVLFGCLGALAVLFVQHRSALPPWHRRVLVEAGLPLALVFLAVGFATPGVDVAAHAGGLAVGLCLTPWLRPRFLDERVRRGRNAALALGMVGVVAAVVFGGRLLGGVLPPLRPERDDGFGIQLPLPRAWRHAADRMGKIAFSNGLPGYGRATLAAEVVLSGEPLDALSQAKRFVAESLAPQALGPQVTGVHAEPPEPLRLSGRDGVRVRAHYGQPSGETELAAYFVPRGDLVYQLVFTWPSALPGYAPVVEALARGIELDEPRALREARGRALLFPGTTRTQGELAEGLRKLGEPKAAVEVLRAVVREAPEVPELRDSLARSLLQAGEVEEGCREARDAAARDPERPSAYELQARCLLARNDPKAALSQLETAARLAPGDERLRAALAALRATVAEGGH